MRKILSAGSTFPRSLVSKNKGIAEQLIAAAEAPGAGLYATLDLAVLDDPKPWLQRLKRHGEACNLFVSQPEASAQTLAVWLLPLKSNNGLHVDAGLLTTIIDQALHADCVTWLVSDLSSDDLAQRLACRLTARLAEGAALFRYYDPRLLPVIHNMSEDAQRASFFALGQTWWYLDAHGRAQRLPLSPAPRIDAFAPPIAINAEQQQALQTVSQRHQLARFMQKRRPLQLAAWSHGRTLDFVEAQEALAQAEGVVDFSDRLSRCLQTLDDSAGVARALEDDDKLAEQ